MAVLVWLCFCPKMASEAISGHLISKKFPDGACPQTPILLYAYAIRHSCNPPFKNPGYGPAHPCNPPSSLVPRRSVCACAAPQVFLGNLETSVKSTPLHQPRFVSRFLRCERCLPLTMLRRNDDEEAMKTLSPSRAKIIRPFVHSR